jgi:DNA-binding Lrp family transcriptional regulator
MSTLMRLLGEAPDGAADIYRSLLGRCDEANKGRRADDLTLVALEATPEPVSRRLRKLRRAGIERCAYLS